MNMSNEEHYYLRHPMQQKFYRYLATALTTGSVGDERLWGYGSPHKMAALQGLIIRSLAIPIIISQFIYLYLKWGNMSLPTLTCIFSIIPFAILNGVYSILSPNTKKYKHLLKDFMGNIHLHNYKNDNKEIDVNKVLLKVENNIRTATCFLLIVTKFTWVAFVIAPVYVNSSNTERILNKTIELQSIIHVVVPYDYEYNMRNWIVQHVINIYISFWATFIFVTGNILICTYVFNLIGHLQLLKQEIKTFAHEAEVGKDKQNLAKIIKHHAFIIRIFKNVQSAFGLNITGNYCHNLIVDSLLLFSIMLGENQTKAMYILMLVTVMGELIQMSYILEKIKNQSDDLSDKVYSMPWEEISLSDQKTFLLLLMRVQPPLEFVAAGGLRAGWKPTISIIKSAFSYFVMLKTTMEYKKT